MKKFIVKVLLILGIPLTLLIVLYIVTDPFRTIYPFEINDCYVENRDVVSTELFVLNNPQYHYNSFMFGNCRSCCVNSYHWKKYLPEGSNQYVFQAWGETITGIRNKLRFLDENGNDIDNVLILIDIPYAFDRKQTFAEAILMQSPRTTKMPIPLYQFRLFCDFAQKPSIWPLGIKRMMGGDVELPCDLVSNDWSNTYGEKDFNVCPPQDSLNRYPDNLRLPFIGKAKNYSDKDLTTSEPQITEDLYAILLEIKSIFDKHHTNAKIVITPSYCYISPSINDKDFNILQTVFGQENIIDYSHKNNLNSDYNNYYDPDHFGLCVGWQMIEDIYNLDK